MPTTPTYLTRLDALPEGYSTVRYQAKTWGCSKATFADGRSSKLFAEALDGSDFISLNLYRTAAGPQLKPCEMPAAKVIAFLLEFELD